MLENKQDNSFSRDIYKVQMRWALVAVRSSRRLFRESDQKEQKQLSAIVMASAALEEDGGSKGFQVKKSICQKEKLP